MIIKKVDVMPNKAVTLYAHWDESSVSPTKRDEPSVPPTKPGNPTDTFTKPSVETLPQTGLFIWTRILGVLGINVASIGVFLSK